MKGQQSESCTTAGTTSVEGMEISKGGMLAVIFGLDDEETLLREETKTIRIIITLFKEAMLGIGLAFAFTSILLFLDHRFPLGLPMAHNIRKYNGAVAVRNFDELKFLDMEEYKSMVQEIAQLADEIIIAKSILRTGDEELSELTKEIAQFDGELPTLFNTLGLDMFCEKCMWGARLNCINRAIHVEEAHNTPKFSAMLSAMEGGKCRKSDAQIKEELERKVLEEKLLKDWDSKNEKEFCFGCEYDTETTCYQRVRYLNHRFAMMINEAKAKVMVEREQCTNSFRIEEDELLRIFNAVWGDKRMSRKRFEYLMYEYPSLSKY